MNLGHCDLFTSVSDACLCVRIDRTCGDLGEGRVVVGRVGESAAVASNERKRLHIDRLIGVLVRIFCTTHDCGSRTIGNTRAIEQAERARHLRGLLDSFNSDLFTELRTRVTCTVVMVLHRDVAECSAHRVFVDAELIAVRRNDH